MMHSTSAKQKCVRAVLLTAIAIAMSASSRASAQGPERILAFVYGVTNYNGSVYASALVPPSVGTIYLLANKDNVIAPRQTQIYFWPITNQFLADWEKMNELVVGQLEVVQQGRLINTMALSQYVIQYDVNDPMGTLGLFTGERAKAKHEVWQKAQDQYRASLAGYSEMLRMWDEQINKLRAESSTGTVPPEKLPKRPEAPPRPTLLSTNPAQGFVISLAAGTYDIQVKRLDGSIQPNSHKRLIVFEPEREGIAYSAVPQQRWTVPEQADEPDGVVYALPGTTLYLQAFRSKRFNAHDYVHMLDPQDQSVWSDRGKWVSFEPATQPPMQVDDGNGSVSARASQPYFVRQLPGGGLGYEVVPFDPNTMEQPTFAGYTLDLNADADYAVSLTGVNGVPIPGSQRRVRTLRTDRTLWLYVVSAMPLALGLVVFFARRRRARAIKIEE